MRLDRVEWSDRPRGPCLPGNKTSLELEDLVLRLRRELKDTSALGEFGAAAILRELEHRHVDKPPSLRTIGRILERRGALDGRKRIRRPPPPRGWYLLDVAAGHAELDCFEVHPDLAYFVATHCHVRVSRHPR
jgi:hypothetical protein